jgi:hypothetical protein
MNIIAKWRRLHWTNKVVAIAISVVGVIFILLFLMIGQAGYNQTIPR